jgi:hypothetical protein
VTIVPTIFRHMAICCLLHSATPRNMAICCLLHSATPHNIIAQYSSCFHESYVCCIGSSPQCPNQCQSLVFLVVSPALSGVLPVSAVRVLESHPHLQLPSHSHHLNVRKLKSIVNISHYYLTEQNILIVNVCSQNMNTDKFTVHV